MVHKFLLLALGLVFALPGTSYAQRGGQQQTEVRIKSDSTSLFPRNFYTLHFLDSPDKSISKFTLRFKAYGVVAGCAAMQKGRPPFTEKDLYKNVKDGAQVTFLNKRLKIEIIDTNIKVNKRAPRYALHDCEKKHNESYVDIPLDRDELIRRGIKKLEVKSANYGDFGIHDVEINEDRFLIKLKSSAGEYWETYWFFPENTISLVASGAKQGQNITELIREFGISHGLIPMDEVLDGYELPHTALHYVFFTDPKRRFIGQLDESGQSTPVGKIKPTRTIYGVNGPREENYTLDISIMNPMQE